MSGSNSPVAIVTEDLLVLFTHTTSWALTISTNNQAIISLVLLTHFLQPDIGFIEDTDVRPLRGALCCLFILISSQQLLLLSFLSASPLALSFSSCLSIPTNHSPLCCFFLHLGFLYCFLAFQGFNHTCPLLLSACILAFNDTQTPAVNTCKDLSSTILEIVCIRLSSQLLVRHLLPNTQGCE